ncbi:MAG: hypothetical protein Kow00121_65220 [Elainellaceae cyanobacterium]
MYSNNHKLDRAMTQEQFAQVVDAILAGKYSWACVLILRFAGYNPLHYIPYRTYNRLMKEHSPNCRRRGDEHNSSNTSHQSTSQNYSQEIRDLAYLEPVGESHSRVRGGDRSFIYPGVYSFFESFNIN